MRALNDLISTIVMVMCHHSFVSLGGIMEPPPLMEISHLVSNQSQYWVG